MPFVVIIVRGVIILDWREVDVKMARAAVDAVSEIMVECGAGGVAVEDPQAIRERIAENSWDAYEFPDELLNRDFVRVTAYFPCDHKLGRRIGKLRQRLDKVNSQYLPGSIKDISFSHVREEDWANSWKAYYKPVKAGERIVIKPTWENYLPAADEIIVELDPGMAFGTGTHPTTVMCIKALEKLIRGGETVFDIGTGSGILSITAAKLGASQVKAVDIDEVAVQAARANAALNGVDGTVEVIAGNLLDVVRGRADIVVANIVADVIIRVCPDAFKAVKKGGLFVASGIIATRVDEVVDHVGRAGFTVRDTVCEGDWVAMAAVRED